MAATSARRRFTVQEYLRLGEVGILHEDDRDELIAGDIVLLAAITPRHANCVNRCAWLCHQLLGDSVIVSVQNPVHLSHYDLPQPDLALVHPRWDDYLERHPNATDTFVLIEIADTSFDYDHKVKLPLYAAANIPEVWLIDLTRQRILRYSEPHEGSYRVVRQFRVGQQITSLVLPGLSLAVGAVFGV